MLHSAAPAPFLTALNHKDTRPFRVLHVIAPAPVGGLERVVCTLVRGQRSAGIHPYVVAVVEPSALEHPIVAELRDSGIDVDVVSISARSYVPERRRLVAACRRWHPDVVHTHGYRSDLVDSGVARALGIPTVSTFHGFTGGPLRNRFYEWLQRRVARRMDAVVAVSRPLGDRLVDSGVTRGRVHVVPNAHTPRVTFVDRMAARRTLGLPSDAFVVGWVGRLTNEKGADVLLDAVARFAGPVVVSIVGDGPERVQLVARASSRAPGRVHWHGIIPNAAQYLRAFDVFALSSRTEGTPMVLFEAMDAEVPIVATRVGGVPDVLRPHDGILIDPENPAALAGAIGAIKSDPLAAVNRASSAKSRLREYDVGSWVEQYNAIYRDLARTTTAQ